MARATVLRTVRLHLEPVAAGHAPEMARVLDDPGLHDVVGGQPLTEAALRARFARQAAGRSPDGTEVWCTWIARRRRDDGCAVGYVQATIREQERRLVADLAWVIAVHEQRRSYAREAAAAMSGWLGNHGVLRLEAHIQPGHQRSEGVATALGLEPTPTVVAGEVVWAGPVV